MTGNIDKAVQAAAKHSYEYEGDRKGILYVGWEYEGEEVREQWRSSVRQVLTAAYPHLPLGFEVKKLEWVQQGDKLALDSVDYRIYVIIGSNPAVYRLLKSSFGTQYVGDFVGVAALEDAKAAAQADFERRVRECVAAKPVDVASVRRQAFEEAKALAFDTSENGQYMGNGDCGENSIYQQGAREVYDTLCDHIESALSAEPELGDHIADVGKMVTADQRQPIETAPKDGSEILAWRVDCGWLIASYTSLDAFPMTQSELDALDEETLFSKDWFTQNGHERLEGSEIPTHWMLLPAAPTSKGGE